MAPASGIFVVRVGFMVHIIIVSNSNNEYIVMIRKAFSKIGNFGARIRDSGARTGLYVSDSENALFL